MTKLFRLVQLGKSYETKIIWKVNKNITLQFFIHFSRIFLHKKADEQVQFAMLSIWQKCDFNL